MRQIAYKFVPQRMLVFIIIFIVFLWNILSSYFGFLSLLFLGVFALAVFLASFRFRLQIESSNFIYKITIFNKTLMKKEIYPEEIKQLTFIRIGWANKAAVIKKHKGFNIRFAELEPQEAYGHLLQFAEGHQIEVFKTKDYLIVERMERNRAVAKQTSQVKSEG